MLIMLKQLTPDVWLPACVPWIILRVHLWQQQRSMPCHPRYCSNASDQASGAASQNTSLDRAIAATLTGTFIIAQALSGIFLGIGGGTPANRQYFIQAEQLIWNYAPQGQYMCDEAPRPFNDAEVTPHAFPSAHDTVQSPQSVPVVWHLIGASANVNSVCKREFSTALVAIYLFVRDKHPCQQLFYSPSFCFPPADAVY